MNGCGSVAEHRKPGYRKRRCRVARLTSASPVSPSTTRERLIASAKIWSLLGSARNLVSGRLIEIAQGVGRDVGIEAVGLGEHDVEGDHGGAELGQVGDQIGDPRPRPRPLAEFRQALFVDIDDGDRPCRSSRAARCAGRYRRSGREAPRSARDRRRAAPRSPISSAKADQPRIAELPREPASQYPQSLHAVWISGSGNLITSDLAGFGARRSALCRQRHRYAICWGGPRSES